MQSTPSTFLAEIGPAFALGFLVLVALTIWEFLRARDLATHAAALVAGFLDERSPGAGGTDAIALPSSPTEAWALLTEAKGGLAAAVTRAQVLSSSIPTLALVGTCLGFLNAMVHASRIPLGTQDPLALLNALLDGGIATALAATVCGQCLYLVLSQVWAWLCAGAVETAIARIDELLTLTRDRMGAGARGVA